MNRNRTDQCYWENEPGFFFTSVVLESLLSMMDNHKDVFISVVDFCLIILGFIKITVAIRANGCRWLMKCTTDGSMASIASSAGSFDNSLERTLISKKKLILFTKKKDNIIFDSFRRVDTVYSFHDIRKKICFRFSTLKDVQI